MSTNQILRGLWIAILLAALWPIAAVQAQQKNAQYPCGLGFVQQTPLLHKAAWAQPNVPTFRQLADAGHAAVQLTFVGHATFEILSPAGVRVVTDYNDFYRASKLPHIATMNIQRGNHSSYSVDPSVKHVLRGWDTGTGIPRHHITLEDVRVYNVPTNILGGGGLITNDSSIFVIDTAGVCIAHMGHLRHVLDDERLARMGRIDVLLMPVDRQVTQSLDEILYNVERINPRLILPMHYYSPEMVQNFVAALGGRYPVKELTSSRLAVTRASLPQKTEIWLIKPVTGFLGFGGDL